MNAWQLDKQNVDTDCEDFDSFKGLRILNGSFC